jgi:putative transposase
LLVVIDEYTRECLAIEVRRSFTAQDVMGVLQDLFAVRGTPEHIRSDNGPEFVSKAICRWLKEADVKTLFIAKLATLSVQFLGLKYQDTWLNPH